jgi:hypothetical protein
MPGTNRAGGSFNIVSFTPHNQFIRERFLIPFYICGLEKVRYIPQVMEDLGFKCGSF